MFESTLNVTAVNGLVASQGVRKDRNKNKSILLNLFTGWTLELDLRPGVGKF